MPKKKKTFDEFRQEKEYIMWERLYNCAVDLKLSQASFESSTCDGVYWEPFLELLYKLGNYLKATGKLKEIKMDYIRPLTYLGEQSNENVVVDGDHYVVDKAGISAAINVKIHFSMFLAELYKFPDLDDKGFQKDYKSFQTSVSKFFKALNAFVKEGWRILHEHIKLILKPLRMLRKSAYRIFSLEKMEKKNEDLTMFSNKKAVGDYVEKVGEFLTQEDYKSKKDADVHKLDEVLGPRFEETYYKYSFEDKVREDEENLGAKEEEKVEEKKPARHQTRKISQIEQGPSKDEELEPKIKEKINVNIDKIFLEAPSQFQKEAMQKDFEDGIDASIDLLRRKLPTEFPYRMEAHKMFVNFHYIPDGMKIPHIKYFLADFQEKLEQLKIICYELKLNGLARLRIPIKNNVELIKRIKDVYDIHIIINSLLGDKLLYDQYLFFYNRIEMITNSSLKEHLEVYKERELIEEYIPRYLVFEAFVHAANVLKKMIEFSRKDGGHYEIDQYYQPTKHNLNSEENLVFNCYEIGSGYDKMATEEIKKKKEIYWKEINQFGRFWMIEGFFPEADKDKWLEAIKILVEINVLVYEDIRDMILLGKTSEMRCSGEDGVPAQSTENDKPEPVLKGLKRMDSRTSKASRASSDRKSSKKGTKTGGRKLSKGRMNSGKKDKGNKGASELGKLVSATTLENLRPPIVWNYPIHRLIEKNNALLKEEKKEIPKQEIRTVNPFKCYSDSRIQQFMDIFDYCANNFFKYNKEHGNRFEYAYLKILKVLKIEYSYQVPNEEEEKNEEEDKKEGDESGAVVEGDASKDVGDASKDVGDSSKEL